MWSDYIAEQIIHVINVRMSVGECCTHAFVGVAVMDIMEARRNIVASDDEDSWSSSGSDW